MQEFDLISKIRKEEKIKDKKVIRGIGDDCAVIDRGAKYELITTDMLVEDDHFKLDWYTPEQIGAKAMQANLSDIAAMGGTAKYAFISLCLSKKVNNDWVERLYRGMRLVNPKYQISNSKQILKFSDASIGVRLKTSDKYLIPQCGTKQIQNPKFKIQNNINILGGDITHGDKIVINICLIGEVEKKYCCFRSGAKVGDLICVTGELGGSAGGLEWLKKHADMRTCGHADNFIQYCLDKHLNPKARVIEGPIIAKYASAMIDVSDGLGSEVRHICEESSVGARVYAEKVPIAEEVGEMGEWMEEHANMRTCEHAHLQKFQIPNSNPAMRDQTNSKFKISNSKLNQNSKFVIRNSTLPLHWAMSGGEDYELVFTMKEKHAHMRTGDKRTGIIRGQGLERKIKFFVVGKIVEKSRGIKFIVDGKEQEMPRGFEHF